MHLYFEHAIKWIASMLHTIGNLNTPCNCFEINLMFDEQLQVERDLIEFCRTGFILMNDNHYLKPMQEMILQTCKVC